jgi:glutamyl-tRNA synthetase
MQYRDDGILPEAMLNYLVRLGWSHGDQELFSLEDLLALFKIEDVSKAPAAFSLEKLLWVNQEKIKAMPLPALLHKSEWYFQAAGIELKQHDNALAVLELMRDRCNTLVELVNQSRFFFAGVDGYADAAVAKWINADTGALIRELVVKLEGLADWQAEAIQIVLQALVKERELGFAKLAQPIRIAVTGDANSPSIDQTLTVLGQVETLARLRAAAAHFSV